MLEDAQSALISKNKSTLKKNLIISILDSDNTDQEATLVYKYQYPEGNIYVHPLTVKDDLIDEVKDLMTVQNLKLCNDELPTQKEIDEYNSCNTLYEEAQKNAHCFRLGITNNGNGKANDISADLVFPDGMLAYYDYDIDYIAKPNALHLPDNPI